MSVDGGTVLTADLVRVQRRSGRLHVIKLEGKKAQEAELLAELLLSELARSEDEPRETLLARMKAVPHKASQKRLLDGLKKLILDGCTFETLEGVEPAELRRVVFELASAHRRGLEPGQVFDRDAVLNDAAESLNLQPEAVDARLYADLKGAHRLVAFARPTPAQLVEDYKRSSAQAVLLKATAVELDLFPSSPAAARRFFHKLKFLRLLYELRPEGTGYHLSIDGPMSLFSSVTKYGLQLAQLVPALERCGAFDLRAALLWGKDKEPLSYALASSGSVSSGQETEVLPELRKMQTQFEALDSDWSLAEGRVFLDVPGLGTCVPDLVFSHRPTGEQIYFELLGFWSRPAVWRRIEWVEAGLDEKILFACSSRLRVSEQALGDDLPSALYVFKGVISARQVLQRLEALRSR